MASKGLSMDTIILAAAILFAVSMIGKPATTTTTTTSNGVDLSTVVQPSITFTGQNLYLSGTALTGESVRVIKVNGDKKDLGQISLNSGTVNTQPNANYKVYCGENSSQFYTEVRDYVAPAKEAQDDVVCKLCTMDTTPTITVFDEFGNVMNAEAGTNIQSIGTSESVDIEVEVKVSADQCFGNPGAPKKNAICFDYNNSAIESIKATGANTIAAPLNISNSKAAGASQICYDFGLLADTQKIRIPVTLKAVTSIDPLSQNFSIRVNDIAFDLNADTLEEIWDFQDEAGHELGTLSQPTTFLEIS